MSGRWFPTLYFDPVPQITLLTGASDSVGPPLITTQVCSIEMISGLWLPSLRLTLQFI